MRMQELKHAMELAEASMTRIPNEATDHRRY
jgi:hypothetical protein